ncbi:hypothetical protein CPC08DRAFT_714916 [Agrocybe pediades]|nr:hypothetical protein CPC08DRAFT_714916 [Agrocybe pediades]
MSSPPSYSGLSMASTSPREGLVSPPRTHARDQAQAALSIGMPLYPQAPPPSLATPSKARTRPSNMSGSSTIARPQLEFKQSTGLHGGPPSTPRSLGTVPPTTPPPQHSGRAPSSSTLRQRIDPSESGGGVFLSMWRCIIKTLAYILAGLTSVVIVAIILGIYAAIGALDGTLCMLIGNGILRVSLLSHYTTDKFAAIIGSIGGSITCLPFLSLSALSNKKPKITFHDLPLLMLSGCALGALIGTIGCAILKKHVQDLVGGIDVLHAARAGAVGGAIMVPANILGFRFVIVLVAGALLSLCAMAVRVFEAVTGLVLGPYDRETV